MHLAFPLYMQEETSGVSSSHKGICVRVLSWLTLCDPGDGNPPGSSVHGIFQAKILEQVAISYARESSQPRD